jgi:hypothetical protein
MTFQYYSRNKPKIGEKVLVNFVKRNDKDSFFEAKILEYKLDGIMIFQDATKKRKIYSWNKIVPLNKNMVAQVDDIDNKNIVQLSIAYLIEKTEDTNESVQENLLVKFNENKLMESFIISLTKNYNFEYSYVWEMLIHKFDTQCEDESLWKYFNDNFDNLDDWIDDKKLLKVVKEQYEKIKVVNYKLVSRFGIISTNGINATKELFKNSLEKVNYKYTLKYQSTPYYLFETCSDDSNKENHEEFIKLLEKNKNIFIKIDYIGKII